MFRELKKLGEGGYGQVYLGRHLVTDEEYAIKFIHPNI
jgi:serine/threonine protein kinase